jgi:hypothetical protein
MVGYALSMEPLSEPLTQALETWRALCRETPCPRRADFDPLKFRSVLGMLSLLEVYRNPWRFKYRVHGTVTALWVGYDLTGKFVDEGANKAWTGRANKHLAQVAISGRPAIERHYNQILAMRNLNVEALVMPLAADGYTVDLLISILIPHNTDPVWRAQAPRTERIAIAEDMSAILDTAGV